MLKGYWIANVDISNLDEYKTYVAANAERSANMAANFCARRQGRKWSKASCRSRIVVIEFPSFEAALACYRSPEYEAAQELRNRQSVADIVVVEGYDGPQP